MRYEELIPFLGSSPEQELFDQYLTTQNVSERPEFGDDSIEALAVFSAGVYLKFDARLFYEKHWAPVVYSGESDQMIFSSFQLYSGRNDNDFKKYSGSLPFGLSFDNTLAEVEKLLGPSTVNHASGPDNRVHVWYDVEGYTIGASFFLDQSGIDFIDVEKKALNPPIPF